MPSLEHLTIFILVGKFGFSLPRRSHFLLSQTIWQGLSWALGEETQIVGEEPAAYVTFLKPSQAGI